MPSSAVPSRFALRPRAGVGPVVPSTPARLSGRRAWGADGRPLAAALLLALAACGGGDGEPVRIPGTLEPSAGAAEQQAPVGTAVPVAPAVRVLATDGRPIAGVPVTFAVATGGGTVTGATPTTGNDGVATLGGWTLGTTAGPQSLTVSVANIATGVTFRAVATPGAPARLDVVPGAGAAGTVGSALDPAPRVRVSDQYGNPVPGATVTFTPSAGSVAAATVAAGADGVARADWTLGPTPGPQTLTAATGTLTATFTATAATAGAATLAKTAGDGQQAIAGGAVAVAPTVRLVDRFGNPVRGVTITFQASAGSVVGPAPLTGDDGTARVGQWTLGNTLGEQTLTATAAGLPPVTFTATAISGVNGTITVVTGAGQSALPGQPVAVPPTVEVRAENGTPVAGVTVTFVAQGGTSRVTGAQQVTDANGRATVGSWVVGTTVGVANTLLVTAPGFPTATTSATTLTGVAAQLSVTRANDIQPPLTVRPGETFLFVVSIRDEFGNLVPPEPGRALTASLAPSPAPPAGAVLAGTLVRRPEDVIIGDRFAASGLAVFQLRVTQPGTVAIRISSPGLTPVDTRPITVGP